MADAAEDLDWKAESSQQDASRFNAAQDAVNTAMNNSNKSPPGSGSGGRPRETMAVPVATLGNAAANQQQQVNAQHSKRAQISNQLLEGSRRVTTQERQRDREYRKTLIQQEKGNADVDSSSWESGNAPDPQALRMAREVTSVIRDAFSNVLTLRREIRQKNVDATANGSPLSEGEGRAVRGAMGDLYPATTELVHSLELGLRSVMPLFSTAMRNTEGLSTLAQIRDQLSAESRKDIGAAQPTSAATLQAKKRMMQEQEDMNNVPVPSQQPQQQQQSSSSAWVPQPPPVQNRTHVSRLDAHPVYDREAESSDHTNKVATHRTAPKTAAASSAKGLSSAPPSVAAAAQQGRQHGAGASSSAILTTLHQVEAEIKEQGEIWPADQRRHQAHSTIHQRLHPNKADAVRRVEEKKAQLMRESGVKSVVPPLLNNMVLASLPASARLGGGSHHGGGMDSVSVRSSRTTREQIRESRRSYNEKQKRLEEGGGEDVANETEQQQGTLDNVTPRSSRRYESGSPSKAAAAAEAEARMARFPQTADGFSSRILTLRDGKVGAWRQLSVTEKQLIVAFDQRENRYHHAHGVNNMKLAGLRMRLRRSQKLGIAMSAADSASLAEAVERKRLLEETRHADVRQTALMLRAWMPTVPERFSDHPQAARQF